MPPTGVDPQGVLYATGTESPSPAVRGDLSSTALVNTFTNVLTEYCVKYSRILACRKARLKRPPLADVVPGFQPESAHIFSMPKGKSKRNSAIL